jgi:hypothetical protein
VLASDLGQPAGIAVGVVAGVAATRCFARVWQRDYCGTPGHSRGRAATVWFVSALLWLYVAQLIAAACLALFPVSVISPAGGEEDIMVWKGAGPDINRVPLVGIWSMIDPDAYHYDEEAVHAISRRRRPDPGLERLLGPPVGE